jgi:hypothetical protein
MSSKPQTIQIFLPDGSPRSVKIAEITNRTVNAVLVPRTKLEYISSRNELQSVGVYFLLGHTDNSTKPTVYIGEAEDCLKRIKQHHKSKDFWTHAIVIVSKTNAFTKSHVKFLEHVSIREAQIVNRFNTENENTPAEPFVTESMKADLMDSFDTIQILLSTLGYPLFDAVNKEMLTHSSGYIFYLTGRGIKAEGNLIEEGFVVYKGSQCKMETVPSCHEYLVNLRENLLHDGILSLEEGNYIFTEDYLFSSPSTAGGVILGRSTNGWTQWKDKSGRTLDDLKR